MPAFELSGRRHWGYGELCEFEGEPHHVTGADGLRIMIVEDQALLAMELELILLDGGCEVVGVAVDTRTAFAVAEREKPDLALVDVNLMDGMTGPQIAHRLVAEHGVAVIFLTANPEQIPDGFSGALGAVCKPFDETTIRGVVDFARLFITTRTVGAPPRRFRLAPWLITPPSDIAPH